MNNNVIKFERPNQSGINNETNPKLSKITDEEYREALGVWLSMPDDYAEIAEALHVRAVSRNRKKIRLVEES